MTSRIANVDLVSVRGARELLEAKERAATSVVSRQDAANFYQSRIIILTMGLILKTATSAENRPET
ncbi:hypothetical protein Tco_1126136, partial [Tanacetum coccineum]